MHLNRILPASLGLGLFLTASVVAQQTPAPAAPRPETTVNTNPLRQEGPRRRGMRARRRMMGQRNIIGQLNLTDAQRQQRHEILQRHLQAVKQQRDELFQLQQKRIEGNFTAEDQSRAKAIREELRTAMQGMRGEMLNTLTTEQRSQLATLREQRRQRREEFMKQRQQFMRTRPQ